MSLPSFLLRMLRLSSRIEPTQGGQFCRFFYDVARLNVMGLLSFLLDCLILLLRFESLDTLIHCSDKRTYK